MWRRPALRLVPALVALMAAVALVDARQAFRSNVELIYLPVVVLDRAGQPVLGLTADDFAIRENGRPEAITSFVAGVTGKDVPLYLGLMLDRSRSMESDLRAASNAAVKFVGALEQARDVTFVDFDTTVRLGRFLPSSYPQLFARIRQRAVGEETALYDAIATYVAAARTREGLHVLLLYSDGGDSASRLRLNDALDLLRQGNVVIYTIGYLQNQSSQARAAQQRALMSIARETGGEAFFPGAPRDLDRVYQKIVAEIQGRYTIGYRSSETRRDGRFRKVEVRVVGNDAARPRTRSGYMAPGEP